MTVIIVIDPGAADPLVHLRGAIASKAALLKQIGLMMVSEAQASFGKQRLGSIEWPQRYPDQEAPFLNIAGAIADFAKGRKAPLARRFQPRPALSDTGEMQASISFRLSVDSVEVGSPLERFTVHQQGLPTAQEISEGTKDRIFDWLESPQGRPYEDKLAPAAYADTFVWITQTVARPMAGITEELQRDIPAAIEEHLASGGA